jgi:hypothetical protein
MDAKRAGSFKQGNEAWERHRPKCGHWHERRFNGTIENAAIH